MIYYANPCGGTDVYDAMLRGDLGCITTPDQGNVVFPDDIDTIADNGCFSAKWEERRWWPWLLDQPRSIRFAVCPDVFDPDCGPCHEETVDRWRHFSVRMRVAGFTPAFVCQVGATPGSVPGDAEVLFLGGTTAWKLGPEAWAIAKAWRDTKWLHMGMVNSERRLRVALAMGCHSCDGTFLTWGPDLNLPRLLHYLRSAQSKPVAPMLWEAL